MARYLNIASLIVSVALLGACRDSGKRPMVIADQPPEPPDVSASHSPPTTGIERVRLTNRATAIQDPRDDGWDTEVFASAAALQLKTLAKAIAERNLDVLPRIAQKDQRFGLLSPAQLVEAFDDHGVRVFHSPMPVISAEDNSHAAKLSQQIKRLLRPHGDAPVEAHFKIVGVELASDHASTRVLFDAKSHLRAAVQQKAIWDCKWRVGESEPILTEIKVSGYELVTSESQQRSNSVWFTDITKAIFGDSKVFRDQFAYGLNYWLERFERAQLMDDSVRTGLAIGDLNGDGLDDVYCCQGPGLPNRLLVQRANGTVEDISHASGTDWLDQTSAALILDFDNDDDQDLAIATRSGLLLMRNDGQARFELVAQLGPEGIDSQSITSADYDQDGDLDIFVCAYRPPSGKRSGDFVFHDAVTGGSNFLFRNDIEGETWSWTDVTSDVGLASGATRYSLAAGWEDYDNDGDQDLYVANDYGRNTLYRNESGKFVDATEDVGLKDTGFGMSVSWGDFDNDGLIDLYVGNMFSSAGSRITSKPQFQPNSTEAQKALYRRMAQGNSLFQSDGTTFHEVTGTAGVAMGRWAWSSVFSDLNSDGLQDIVIANGYITTDDNDDL